MENTKKEIKKEAKKLTKEELVKVIKEEANIYKRKLVIFEEVKRLNNELKQLSENHPIGSFGFANPSDTMNKSKTGFVDAPNISHIAELEREMAGDGSTLTEVEKLQQENEVLRKELEEMKTNSPTLAPTMRTPDLLNNTFEENTKTV